MGSRCVTENTCYQETMIQLHVYALTTDLCIAVLSMYCIMWARVIDVLYIHYNSSVLHNMYVQCSMYCVRTVYIHCV